MNSAVSLLETLKTDPVYSNWKIVDVEDQNDGNGFYALTIETDADSAIIGFRGSETTILKFKKEFIQVLIAVLQYKFWGF